MRCSASLLGALFAASALSCEAHPHEFGHEHPDTPSGATCPPTSTLTWENFGRPFVETHCTTCHSVHRSGDARQGALPGTDFDTAENVRAWADPIDRHAAAGSLNVNRSMPTTSPVPSDEERRRLGEWLACGAP